MGFTDPWCGIRVPASSPRNPPPLLAAHRPGQGRTEMTCPLAWDLPDKMPHFQHVRNVAFAHSTLVKIISGL